jgi:hypothetical protein
MSSIYEKRKTTHSKEMSLRCIMAIIYEGGHWANSRKKIDLILAFIGDELAMMEEQK